MNNAQMWLDNNYPLEKRKEINKLNGKNIKLEGKLSIQDWHNLEVIFFR